MLSLWGSAICCRSWSSCCSPRRSLQWRWSAEGWKTDWIWSDLQYPEDQWWTWWVDSLMLLCRNVWSSDQHMNWQLHVWIACLIHLKWRMMVSAFVFRRSVFIRHRRIFSVMIDPHSDINRILDKVPDSNSISNVQVKQHVHQLLI